MGGGAPANRVPGAVRLAVLLCLLLALCGQVRGGADPPPDGADVPGSCPWPDAAVDGAEVRPPCGGEADKEDGGDSSRQSAAGEVEDLPPTESTTPLSPFVETMASALAEDLANQHRRTIRDIHEHVERLHARLHELATARAQRLQETRPSHRVEDLLNLLQGAVGGRQSAEGSGAEGPSGQTPDAGPASVPEPSVPESVLPRAAEAEPEPASCAEPASSRVAAEGRLGGDPLEERRARLRRVLQGLANGVVGGSVEETEEALPLPENLEPPAAQQQSQQMTIEPAAPPSPPPGPPTPLQALMDQLTAALGAGAKVQVHFAQHGAAGPTPPPPPALAVEGGQGGGAAALARADAVDPAELELPPLVVDGTTHSRVRRLDAGSYLPVLAHTAHSLVLFHTAWDSHLVDLLPQLVRIAPRPLTDRLRGTGHAEALEFPLFAVDMFRAKAVAEFAEVETSGTLAFMHYQQKSLHYNGIRRTLPIQSFCERMIDLAAVYDTDSALEVVMRTAEVAVVGYVPDNQSSTHDVLHDLVHQMVPFVPMGIVYGKSMDDFGPQATFSIPGHHLHRPILSLQPQFNRSEDSVLAMVFKQAQHTPEPRQLYLLYDGVWDVGDIMTWAAKHSYPYLQELSAATFHNIYANAVNTDGAIVILFLSVRQGEHLEERYAEELEQFRHIGVHARHHGSGPLYLLYGTVQRYGEFATRLGWGPHINAPFYVSILCPKEQHVLTTTPPSSLLEVKELLRLARDPGADGSSALPPDQLLPPTLHFHAESEVVQLTEANFNLLVMQDCAALPITTHHYPHHLGPRQECSEHIITQREVLVLFHTPWCGYCKAFWPQYRQLSLLLKQLIGDEFLVGEYNCQDYQVPFVLDSIVEGFPEVILFPFQRKHKAYLYQGAERTLPALVSFILSNSQLSPTAVFRLRMWLYTNQ